MRPFVLLVCALFWIVPRARGEEDVRTFPYKKTEQTPNLGGTYRYGPTGASWVFSGGTGMSANNTAFTSGNGAAPELDKPLAKHIGETRVVAGVAGERSDA